MSRKQFKVVGNIYRSPGTDLNKFIEKTEEILTKIKNDPVLCKPEEVQLLGDFNINLIKYETHEPTAKFLDTLFAFNQLPLISLPSRITNTSSTLIDNIFTNKNQELDDSGLIYCCMSDHLPVFNIYNLGKKAKHKSPTSRLVRKFSEENKATFRMLLDNTEWNSLFSEDEPKIAFKMFEDNIDSCFEKAFPLENKKIQNETLLGSLG